MNKTCPTCLHEGEPKFRYQDSFRLPIAAWFIGLVFYWLPIKHFSNLGFNTDSYFYIALPIIAFLVGFFLFLSFYIKNSDLCPKCGYGHMADNLDTESSKTAGT